MSQLDSTQQDGATGANPPASSAGVQPNSFDPATFAETLKADILKAIREDKTLVQSVKDRTIADVKKDRGLREFLDEYRSMKSQGMTDEQILLEARLREIEAKNVHPAPVAPGSPTSDSGTNDLEDLLPDLGLAPDDGDVLRIMAQPTTPLAKAKELAKLSQRRKNPPSPAAAAQPPAAPQPANNTDELRREYQSRLKSIGPNPAQIATLKAEYRKKGLDVW